MGNLHKIASILLHYSTELRTSQPSTVILFVFGEIAKKTSEKEKTAPDGGG